MMYSIFSFLIYTGVAISILQDWKLLAMVLVVLFSVRHGAILLIPLAIVIDGYFGNFYTIPLISFTSVWWYSVVLYFRPKIVNLRTTKAYESIT